MGGDPEDGEKQELFKRLNTNGKMPADVTEMNAWGRCTDGKGDASTPFVTACLDGKKQQVVKSIKKWYESKNIWVEDSDIHFFDDRANNVQPFIDDKEPYIAKQIACASRDPGNTAIG